jgi:protein-tyrosine phosphatase
MLGDVITAGVCDHTDFDIKPIADRILVLLHETPHRRILFRCYAGISRSVTMAALYMAQTTGISPAEALRLIQEKRPQALPNPGFLKLLTE